MLLLSGSRVASSSTSTSLSTSLNLVVAFVSLMSLSLVRADDLLLFDEDASASASAQLELVDVLRGELRADQLKHYRLTRPGDFIVRLASLQGDVDLYATDKHRQVDCLNYDATSRTYGIDQIHVTAQMQRPVAVGIHAHFYYARSRFLLHVYAFKPKLLDLDLDGTARNFYATVNQANARFFDEQEQKMSSDSKGNNNNEAGPNDSNNNNYNGNTNRRSFSSSPSSSRSGNQNQKNFFGQSGGDGYGDGGEDDEGGKENSLIWLLFKLLELAAEIVL